MDRTTATRKPRGLSEVERCLAETAFERDRQGRVILHTELTTAEFEQLQLYLSRKVIPLRPWARV
jgi:hypothetical protein